nr:hypothetical protein [Cribrihabitans marinus]
MNASMKALSVGFPGRESRFNSEGISPAYIFFQLKNVAELIPAFRQTSRIHPRHSWPEKQLNLTRCRGCRHATGKTVSSSVTISPGLRRFVAILILRSPKHTGGPLH